MASCAVDGCPKTAAGDPRFGRFCTGHRARLRRHGDASQRTVTLADLKPHLASIERHRKRKPEAKAWGLIEERWRAMAEHCKGEIAEAKRAGGVIRQNWRAWNEAVKIADSVPAADVWQRPVAVFMLREAEPRAFASDRGFRFELVRVTRQLADVNRGTAFDHKTGKMKRYYTDLPPKSADLMGSWFAEVFGAPGLLLARLDKEGAARKASEANAFRDALKELDDGDE